MSQRLQSPRRAEAAAYIHDPAFQLWEPGNTRAPREGRDEFQEATCQHLSLGLEEHQELNPYSLAICKEGHNVDQEEVEGNLYPLNAYYARPSAMHFVVFISPL